jgi:hydroxymethylbilane synthase
MTELRIATRGSMLALWQAEHIRGELLRLHPSLTITLLVLKTQGDRILDRPLSEVGGKGLFTKEIEEALLDRRADLAVHSMKDLPSALPPGLTLAAIPPRADVADALVLAPVHRPLRVGNQGASALLAALPSGARVGTSSLRRVCQLRRLRPDLHILPLRGNVDTRLRRVHSGELDAAVLAAAGLRRLGFDDQIALRFSPSDMLPACGQGALGLECRHDDPAVQALLTQLSDEATTAAVLAERAFSLRLGGSCQTPLGALASLHGPAHDRRLRIAGMVGSVDGLALLRDQLEGPADAPAELGRKLGDRLLGLGAGPLLQAGPGAWNELSVC